MIYRCFKCNESGMLRPDVLDALGLLLTTDQEKQFNLFNRLSRGTAYFRDRIKTYEVPVPKDTAENARKLDYINRRLDINLVYDECPGFKIVPSIVEFMRHNHLKISKEDIPDAINLPPRSILELENHYVGFLCSNNNKLVFRDITPDGSGYFGRYYKVTIDVYNLTPNTFYALQNQFDPLYTGPIDINISEGTFDILAIYKNFHREPITNSLFFAACGYGFSTIMKYLIYMGVTSDIRLHIWSDNDKSDREHRKELWKRNLDQWIDHVIIHRNGFDGEKDFGVPASRMQEYSYELKM